MTICCVQQMIEGHVDDAKIEMHAFLLNEWKSRFWMTFTRYKAYVKKVAFLVVTCASVYTFFVEIVYVYIHTHQY